MVRLALLIVSLLGMFLLNACSGSNNNPSNIDTTDAVSLQTGRFSAKAQDVKYTKFNDKGQKEEAKQELIFNPEVSGLEVDWDTKTVVLTTEYMPEQIALNKNLKAGKITLQGTFNDEGIAFIEPVDPELRKANALFAVSCADNLCKDLQIDLASDIQENGKTEYKEQVMVVPNPSPLKVTVPVSTTKEVDPVGSGLRNSADKKKATQTAAEKKAEEAKAAEEKKKADEAKAKEEAESAAAQNDELSADDAFGDEGMIEPGVPTLQPSRLRPEMRNRPDGVAIKLNDYSESSLFPFDLGEKYPSKAQGFYSFCTKADQRKGCKNGSLVKGIDVTLDGIGNLVRKLGFASKDRSDKRYYGSGLLVKNIEEVGRAYAQKYPNDNFYTDDLSQKAGGPIYCRNSKGKIVRCKGSKSTLAHASHQNGLDVDISLPKKATMVFDYQKAWFLIDRFVKLGYVDVIFLNPIRIKEMCSYLKKNGEINKPGVKETFGHLYKESGHKTHMHVRLKCTNHNRGCFQAGYSPGQYGVCK